jgi:Holliday junction resolvase
MTKIDVGIRKKPNKKSSKGEESEAELVKRMVKALRKLPKTEASKIHGDQYQERGIPDIMGCYKGHAFVIEAKRPSKEKNLSAYQALKLKRYKLAGCRTGVATTVEQALAIATGKKVK